MSRKKRLISVAMIARNEAPSLVRAIPSALRFADEVVVMDTGSTDNTFRVARDLGARVYRHGWHHHFADARNESFARCHGKYIVWMDPDEEILQPVALRKIAGRGEVDDLSLPTFIGPTYRPAEEDIPGYGPGFRVTKSRMVRNCSDVSWRFRVHEGLFWSREHVAQTADIGVHNRGVSAVHDPVGADYYFALLVLGHREDPTEAHYALYLADYAITHDGDPKKALDYLAGVDVGKLTGVEELWKYWLITGRAWKASAIYAYQQGAVDKIKPSVDNAVLSYDQALQAKSTHQGTLEAATMMLEIGQHELFRKAVAMVITDTPNDLQANALQRIAEQHEDPAVLAQAVRDYQIAIAGGMSHEDAVAAVMDYGKEVE